MPVYARLWRKVVIAETALQRGQLLNDAPLILERRDVLTLRDPLYELPSALANYEMIESLPAGAPLTLRAFRLKPVVFRGKTVDAVMRDNSMTILLKVEVLEEGVPGQFVRVRNLQSRRELRGKVQDERTIAISL
jgi:flagella basal body P-ring formation protein FlgA